MCPDDTDLLRLLADELDDSARQRLRAHLAVCAVCQARMSEYQKVWDAIGDADVTLPDRDLTAAILRAASTSSAGSTRLRIAAAILLAIGGGVAVGASLPVRHPIAKQASDSGAVFSALGLDVFSDDHTGLTSVFTDARGTATTQEERS